MTERWAIYRRDGNGIHTCKYLRQGEDTRVPGKMVDIFVGKQAEALAYCEELDRQEGIT